MSFHDREAELATLEGIAGRKSAQLVAIFGRRRIGKTALLVRWLDTLPPDRRVYWVAHRSTSGALLASFSRALEPLMGAAEGSLRFESWRAALEHVARAARERPLTIVIDELPYLLESEPAFATLLQAVWDHELKRSRARIVLAGSHYHMMNATLSSPSGALYGRTTADLLVDELDIASMKLFLPRYSPEQLVETYSVVGGVPKYLEMWNGRRSVESNIRDVVLSAETVFRNEAAFLIQDEIAEPRTYVAILEAIGTGAARPVDIARTAAVNPAHVGKYLHTLEQLRFVRRIVSAEVRDPRSSRGSKYEIRDPYLRFHFTLVQPHLRLIEQARIDRVLEQIRKSFDAHVGRTGYEEVCRRWLAARADAGELSFDALEVGRMWDRRTEVDVAALDQKRRIAMLGECRWRSRKMAPDDLDALQRKATAIRALEGYDLRFALFSRSGFTKTLQQRAEAEDVLLVRGVPG